MDYESQNSVEKERLSSPFTERPTAVTLAGEQYLLARWNVPQAFMNWGASIAFALLPALLLIGLYAAVVDMSIIEKLQRQQLTAPIMILQLVGTFIGQILSVALCWIIVTGMGKRSFGKSLGLQWPQNFKPWQALVLGLGMFALSGLLMNILPRHETDMDKFLKFGTTVRVVLALVATIGAPIQEEIVYRGVLYTALEKSIGTQKSLILVSLLFWGVHVAQYWQSIATLVAVLLLSFVLTALRAWSGKLMPCIATHLFFNGIQGFLIVFAPEKAATPEPAAQPAFQFLSLLNG